MTSSLGKDRRRRWTEAKAPSGSPVEIYYWYVLRAALSPAVDIDRRLKHHHANILRILRRVRRKYCQNTFFTNPAHWGHSGSSQFLKQFTVQASLVLWERYILKLHLYLWTRLFTFHSWFRALFTQAHKYLTIISCGVWIWLTTSIHANSVGS